MAGFFIYFFLLTIFRIPQIPNSINCHLMREATTFLPRPWFLEMLIILRPFFLPLMPGSEGFIGCKGLAGYKLRPLSGDGFVFLRLFFLDVKKLNTEGTRSIPIFTGSKILLIALSSISRYSRLTRSWASSRLWSDLKLPYFLCIVLAIAFLVLER